MSFFATQLLQLFGEPIDLVAPLAFMEPESARWAELGDAYRACSVHATFDGVGFDELLAAARAKVGAEAAGNTTNGVLFKQPGS